MYDKSIRRIRINYIQMLAFNDFDSLADCAVMLVKRHIPCSDSRLYQIGKEYRLLIRSDAGREWSFCNEFCIRQSRSALEAAYTEEHGKILMASHAVRRIGKAFMKDFSKA